jgi:predicted Zn-dependent protease
MPWLHPLLLLRKSKFIHMQEQSIRLPYLFVLAFLILITACANTTRPGAVGVNRSQFMMVSSSEINQISASAYQQERQKAQAKNMLLTSGPTYNRLRKIADRLIPQTKAFRDDTSQWNWELTLIKSPALNATCAPGGKMTFYTGLIEQLNLNDDEIAAIMGHEMAHALREHGRERVSQAMAQNVVANVALAAAGPYGSAVSAANQVAHYVLVLPNSRENESEADAIGLELAARAGYNPRGSITLWEKMLNATKDKNTLEFLSTHPSGETRIEQLNALMPLVDPLYQVSPKATTSKK